ncbi:MAG: hypothetical protein HQ463_05980 [Bacteroidetes bacterium]|nr:hypothetical protein [Bacteroidota bacterium]
MSPCIYLKKNPYYISKIILLATKLNCSSEIIDIECKKLTPINLEAIIDKLQNENIILIENSLKITQDILD